jgi:hypothetical protein
MSPDLLIIKMKRSKMNRNRKRNPLIKRRVKKMVKIRKRNRRMLKQNPMLIGVRLISRQDLRNTKNKIQGKGSQMSS